MSSYQPVSLPQNHYPSVPYTQSFPEGPESESIPLNNHSQHHYPPNHSYGYEQQHPGQFYGGGAPQGFPQGPQFMMVPVDPERRGLAMKISDLEKELDSGWYFVYKIYLYINIGAAILGLLQLALVLLMLPMMGQSKEGVVGIILGILIILFLVSIYGWVLHYSLVLKNAMSDKSLTGARRGLKSYTGYSIYCLVIIIFLIAAAEYIRIDTVKESWTHYYVKYFLYLYVVPVVVHNFAARKIIALLVQRDSLVSELNTRYGTNIA